MPRDECVPSFNCVLPGRIYKLDCEQKFEAFGPLDSETFTSETWHINEDTVYNFTHLKCILL